MGDIKNASDHTGKKPVEQLGIKALNDETLQIELEKPVPYINQLLALNTFAPQNEKVTKNMVKITVRQLIERYTMVHLKLMIGNKKIKPYYLKIRYYWDKKNVKLDKVNYKVIKATSRCIIV